MSRTVNKIELLGRLGADPDVRTTNSGTTVANLRLATERRVRDGEPETDWHTVVCWAGQADAVGRYLGKGDRVYVAGRLGYSTWEGSDGQVRHKAEVHASEVVFLDSRNGNGHGNGDGRGHAAYDAASPF